MNRIAYIFFALALCFSFNGNAQVKVSYPGLNDTITGIRLHSDPRLAIVLRKQKNVQMGVIRSGRGYRVQIYNGNDRVKANSVKIDFMRRYPAVRTYLSYSSPQFRVKVGDYRTRQEAEAMYRIASDLYNPCMIVPDIIIINTLSNSNDN